MQYRRVFLIVLDGLGIGSAHDAEAYGDMGSDTLLHLAQSASLDCPNLAKLGLSNLYPFEIRGINHVVSPNAVIARLTEVSAGKDTTTGHWELMGLTRASPAPTFPNGFPKVFMQEFAEKAGRGVLGNKAASGTVIINELGEAHVFSGDLIVYTSADSVFQIAAHVDVVPLDELYSICVTARDMLTGEREVDRVIARPFTGQRNGKFVRTEDRKDYSLPPPGITTLNILEAEGFDVIGVGKISDIFAGSGITANYSVHGNENLMEKVDELAKAGNWRGLTFCNLVDFDMLYGHRNNPTGYAEALNEFDTWLGGFLAKMRPDDLLILTADHGNDPTTPSTDHSREQVPFLATSSYIATKGGTLVTPPMGFHHVGKTVLDALGIDSDLPGENLLPDNQC